MGAAESFSTYASGESLFTQLSRLLVDRSFLEFAWKIRPVLETPTFHNREVYVLLLKDALDLLGPDETDLDYYTIEGLVSAFLPEYAETRLQSAMKDESPLPPLIVSPRDSTTIQLRRVVQVTTYSNAGFEDSDHAGIQLDSVKQDGRFTVNHLGRLAGVIVGG